MFNIYKTIVKQYCSFLVTDTTSMYTTDILYFTLGFFIKEITRMPKVYHFLFIFFAFILVSNLQAQDAIIKGIVTDAETNEPVAFANVVIVGTSIGGTTDLDGNYMITTKPGTYTFVVSYLGYENGVASEVEVGSVRPTQLDFALSNSNLELEEVVVKADAFKESKESPVSLRSIGVSEIRRNPGANRDISKVVQSLPGVTSSAAGFRNDLIIRGGAPNENRFYLDGVEVPNINHYATQGAGGGPAGLINVNFIREVDFYSGAFPAKYGNALSSVFDFSQRNGRDDRIGGSLVVSGTDAGLSLEGPLGKNTTFLASARRSYLSLIFSQLGLPFLPTYNDFQVKTRTKIGKKHEILFIGLGAYDAFKLNLDAGVDESSLYLLDNLPETPQWNYTNGLVYKNYHKHGYFQLVVSRNMLNNRSFKYKNNDKSSEDNLILDYNSQEIENKFRFEDKRIWKGLNLNYGALYEYVKYNLNSDVKVFIPNQGIEKITSTSDINFNKYGLFGQVSKSLLSDRLNVSLGVRLDGNTYSENMSNPLNQVSPRFSASYKISESFSFNANTGLYYQLPSYTTLGYNVDGILANKPDLKYIRNWHAVAGFAWNSTNLSKLTIEGFYKKYDNYPFLTKDSVTLANFGGDFGVVGNERAISTASGNTYGLEVLFQQRLYKGFYGILAYTLGWSEFDDKNQELIPSSWDARHIVSATLGKQFRNNWEIGTAIRFQSALPTTPFDPDANLRYAWDVNNRAFPDYSRLNSERGDYSLGVDIRIDKKWFFKKWSLNIYMDVENVTANSPSNPQIILDRPLDENGLPVGDGIIENPNDLPFLQRYKVKEITAGAGAVIPSIGVQIDF